MKYICLLLTFHLFGSPARAEDNKTYTTYNDGKKVNVSQKAPKESPDDFYVKSLGIRIQKNAEATQSPYDAIVDACEKKKDGTSCFYVGAFHEERKNPKKAAKFFKLACEFGSAEGCEKSR